MFTGPRHHPLRSAQDETVCADARFLREDYRSPVRSGRPRQGRCGAGSRGCGMPLVAWWY
eukprot:scaffold23997_cov84-Isochrysis_galbana.AAC.1